MAGLPSHTPLGRFLREGVVEGGSAVQQKGGELAQFSSARLGFCATVALVRWAFASRGALCATSATGVQPKWWDVSIISATLRSGEQHCRAQTSQAQQQHATQLSL
eukprot:TRINITY_DN8735_c0_g1_i1.p2 TRINITY_DN8735_c0_g1~~TRINITY_DN8735_c0_g1_i1.p2  ORF type:complete len:106 (+),score=11.67 TRINITY_DN8735_c0_g1_i1:141-458(+)